MPHKSNKTAVSPLNMSQTNGGKFEGWGTSLCWWANRIGYSDKLSQQAAELFFGENVLRLNIMRYNIGGGDDPSHNHITRTDSAVPGWLSYDKESGEYTYDYSADRDQLNVLKRAYIEAGEDAYVEVFSNSPPWFMTVSGCSSGNTDPKLDNLKSECYSEFAEYLAHVTKYINDEMDIKVSSVSPMNEPNTDYWWAYNWKQEGCHFDAGAPQSRIIEETAAAFGKHGLSGVIIAASDETSPEKQITAYNSYSDKARAVIGRISTHTYDTRGIEELGKLAKAEKFNLWMSEVDGGRIAGENADEMGAALWIAEKIINDMNSLSPSAWVMWQVIDNHISSEGYNGNADMGMADLGGGYWGATFADHDNDKIVLSQKYYGIGQFTRYIRPGASIIHCDSDNIAAFDGENGRLVIVSLNKLSENASREFDLAGFDITGGAVKAIRTSGSISDGEHWTGLDDIQAHENGFTAELKGNSITTFIIDGTSIRSEKSNQ